MVWHDLDVEPFAQQDPALHFAVCARLTYEDDGVDCTVALEAVRIEGRGKVLSLNSIAHYKRSPHSSQSVTFIFWYISSPASVSRTISTQRESADRQVS
jgi:hypothetical protein